MTPEPRTTLALEFGDRVIRSWWTVVAGVCIGLAGAIAALDHIPKIYEARTLISVREQQLPQDVVRTTVTDDGARQLAFREAVLDPHYMAELINRTFGFPDSEEQLQQLINRVRGSVAVNPMPRRIGVTAFQLTFRDTDPQRAAKVLNTLTDLYVSQNREFRASQSGRIAETIEEMAGEAKEKFDAKDRELTEFKQQHSYETEAHLGPNLRLMESSQRDLENIDVRRGQSRDKLEELQRQLAAAQGLSTEQNAQAIVSPIVMNPLSQRIADLRQELDDLRVHYSEQHPEVIKKKRELEDLITLARERADPESGTTGPGTPAPVDPALTKLQTQIQDLVHQIETFDATEARLLRDIEEYKRRIAAEPEVQRQLNELQEEHAVLRENYRKLERDAERARGSQDLEESSLAQGMEIVERAMIPRTPIAPQATMIYGIGVGIGCLIFVGPMMTRFVLNPPICSESGLRSLVDIPVLASIPRIDTPTNRGQGRRRFLKNLALSAVSSGALVAVVLLMA